MAKSKYHKGVLETVRVLLIMASNDYEKMITIANEEDGSNPPQRFMEGSTRGKKFSELPLKSLEFVYFALESKDLDLKYRMIAKCCLYRNLKKDKKLFNSEFGEFYDNPEEAMDDFILEEIKAVKPYLAEITKPMLVNKIKGKYDEWKSRVGINESDEGSEEDFDGVQSEERLKDDERSSGDNEEIADW